MSCYYYIQLSSSIWPNDDLLTLLDWALEFRLLIATAQEEIIHGNR